MLGRGVALVVSTLALVSVYRHGAPHSSLRSAARRFGSFRNAPSIRALRRVLGVFLPIGFESQDLLAHLF